MSVKLSKFVVAPSAKIDLKLPYTSLNVSFQLENIFAAYVAALRKVIACEIPVKCLDYDFADFKTNDEYIIDDMIRNRIRQIPIDQKLDGGFKLEFRNDTQQPAYVMSSELKPAAANSIAGFNKNIIICSLNPRTSMYINNIKVVTGYHHINACFTLAVNVAAVCETPIDPYTEEPTTWTVKFKTNGTAEPRDIIAAAINEIKRRAAAIGSQTARIVSAGSNHVMTIEGENITVGMIMSRAIFDLYPGIVVKISDALSSQTLAIEIVTDENPADVIKNASIKIQKIYSDIEKYL